MRILSYLRAYAAVRSFAGGRGSVTSGSLYEWLSREYPVKRVSLEQVFRLQPSAVYYYSPPRCSSVRAAFKFRGRLETRGPLWRSARQIRTPRACLPGGDDDARPRGGVAGTRGGSAGDPRPPASSANAARACLEHLCDCLRALGVGTAAGASHDPTALTAETLRRAKFDQPAAAAPLWRALHDLFLVSHAGFPEPSVAAETLRVLRDETARREDVDENETPAETETETRVETHRCVALRGLRLAKYPRLETLELEQKKTDDTSNRGESRESETLPTPSSSRAILVALAWAVADLDVFALAHADRSARELMSASGLVEPNTSGDNRVSNSEFSNASLLPPYGSDAASSPTRAETHASVAEAAERAYLDAAAKISNRASGTSSFRSSIPTRHTTDTYMEKAFVSKQAALLSQRVWQSVSHVRALERSRGRRAASPSPTRNAL